MKLVWSALLVPSFGCHELQGCTIVGFSKRNSRRTVASSRGDSWLCLRGSRRSEIPQAIPGGVGDYPREIPGALGDQSPEIPERFGDLSGISHAKFFRFGDRSTNEF